MCEGFLNLSSAHACRVETVNIDYQKSYVPNIYPVHHSSTVRELGW